jgi:hypothetical protein
MDCADDLIAVTDDVTMTADGDDGVMICIVDHDAHCQGFHSLVVVVVVVADAVVADAVVVAVVAADAVVL